MKSYADTLVLLFLYIHVTQFTKLLIYSAKITSILYRAKYDVVNTIISQLQASSDGYSHILLILKYRQFHKS